MTTDQLDELKAIQDAYLDMATKRQEVVEEQLEENGDAWDALVAKRKANAATKKPVDHNADLKLNIIKAQNSQRVSKILAKEEVVEEQLEEAVGGFGSHYSKSEKEKEMADDHKDEKETSYRSKSPKRSGFSALDRLKAKQGIKEEEEVEELDESGWPSKGESMKTTATITKNKDGSTTTAFPDGTWKIESKGYKAEKKPTNLVYTHAKSDVAYQNLVYKKSGPDNYQLNKEEVEELEELSKATLGSYVKKASDDKADFAFQQGQLAGNQTKNKVAIQTSIDNEKKRRAGISKAVGKLTKEEVEELEEGNFEKNMDIIKSGKLPPHIQAILDKRGAKGNDAIMSKGRSEKLKSMKEMLDEARAKKEPMEVYHTGYSAALQHAEKHLNKQGYEIHPDDWQHHISHGPSKPSEGKTVQLHVPLHKDGVKTKKVAHIQVYNRGNTIPKNNELNMYVN